MGRSHTLCGTCGNWMIGGLNSVREIINLSNSVCFKRGGLVLRESEGFKVDMWLAFELLNMCTHLMNLLVNDTFEGDIEEMGEEKVS